MRKAQESRTKKYEIAHARERLQWRPRGFLLKKKPKEPRTPKDAKMHTFYLGDAFEDQGRVELEDLADMQVLWRRQMTGISRKRKSA